VCRSHHLVNAHEVKPVRLIQSLCAVCGSNLDGLTLLYIVLPCVVAVVSLPAWQMLILLIARYVSNLINKHYYYIIITLLWLLLLCAIYKYSYLLTYSVCRTCYTLSAHMRPNKD